MNSEQAKQTEARKNDHIDIVLNKNVNAKGITTGFEKFRFRHNALPELDFADINIRARFLDKNMTTPFLVSSMTGGTKQATEINLRLASVAEKRGWAMGVGSIRAAIENKQLAHTFDVRKVAPTIPLLANLGAVQLNYGYTIEHCQRAVELIDADGLVLHLNSIQEGFQPEGNTNFKHLLAQIKQLCRKLDVPVGIKEVGWGINAETAIKLVDAGVTFIDVAGAGGTSWSEVEKHRSHHTIMQKAAEAFKDWGNPTADCIIETRNSLPHCLLIGSGGIKNGVEAAKAICLGSDLVGLAQPLLSAATKSEEALDQMCAQIEYEFKMAMFGVGVGTIEDLKLKPQLLQFKAL